MFESNEMQRISLNLIGRPYNICLGCSEKYKNKDMWDDNKNDIDWNKVPCIDDS
ncbi:hypothetical protein AB37_2577 [Escherichia coli 8-415-05_S1_C2]|nr:hypothetical protein AB37_2577 [Escherichia coli 8-415-05_S1_C2]